MAAWRIIDLTQFSGSISSKTGAIVLHPEDKPQVVLPVADVAVVLIGMGVKLSGAVLHRLTAADVWVLLCDWRGIPEAGTFAWRPHSRVAARRVAQAGMSVPKQKTAWKAVVKRKIENQAKTLLLCGKQETAKSWWSWQAWYALAIPIIPKVERLVIIGRRCSGKSSRVNRVWATASIPCWTMVIQLCAGMG